MAAPNTVPEGPRERIVHEARQLFAAHGFSRVTLRSIGARVGLHNSTLFHHFRGKGEIAQAVFDGVLERLLPMIEPIGAGDPPDLDRFVERMVAVAEYFMDEPDDARFLVRVLLDPEVFLASYVGSIDPDDAESPIVRLFSLVWGWLGRARGAGVIREVRVYQATRNLFGVVLFEPVYAATDSSEDFSAGEVEERRRHRRLEVAAFVRGALEPVGGER